MRGHDPRNAIIAILCLAIAVVLMQLIRGHSSSRKSKDVSEPLHCAQTTAVTTTITPTLNDGQYDIGPFDESISQGLKLDYSLKLLYCNTPKGGKQHAFVGSI